jgi:hypothetical protein
MLFVSMGKPRTGEASANTARRIQWDYPPGANMIAECWLQDPDVTVVSIFEADSIAPILAVTAEWDDAFSWTVVPATTAEDGIAVFKSIAQ